MPVVEDCHSGPKAATARAHGFGSLRQILAPGRRISHEKNGECGRKRSWQRSANLAPVLGILCVLVNSVAMRRGSLRLSLRTEARRGPDADVTRVAWLPKSQDLERHPISPDAARLTYDYPSGAGRRIPLLYQCGPSGNLRKHLPVILTDSALDFDHIHVAESENLTKRPTEVAEDAPSDELRDNTWIDSQFLAVALDSGQHRTEYLSPATCHQSFEHMRIHERLTVRQGNRQSMTFCAEPQPIDPSRQGARRTTRSTLPTGGRMAEQRHLLEDDAAHIPPIGREELVLSRESSLRADFVDSQIGYIVYRNIRVHRVVSFRRHAATSLIR